MKLCEFFRDREYLEKLTVPSARSMGDYKVIDFWAPPQQPPERIEALVTHLASAHDGFRSGFHRMEDGSLRARFWDDSRPSWNTFEVEYLEADLLPIDEFRAKRYGDIDLHNGRPAAFYYFSSPRQSTAILRLLCSHFIWDQFTHAAVANTMIGFWKGGRLPPKEDTGYADWMDAYANHARSPAGFEAHRFWASEPSIAFERLQHLKPLVSDRAAHEATLSIPYPLYGRLDKLARQTFRCRVSDLVTMAIFAALGREFAMDEVPVNWTCHGRFPIQSKRFANTVGYLTSRHPFVFPIGDGDPGAAFGRFRGAMLRLPQHGNSYAWIMRFSKGANSSGMSQRLYSPITINVRDGFVRPDFEKKLPAGNDLPDVALKPLTDWRSGSHMYIVLDVGATLRVSVTSFDNPASPTTSEKVAAEIGAFLQRIGR